MRKDWSAVEPAFRAYLLTTAHSQATAVTYVASSRLCWQWCVANGHDPILISDSTLSFYIADMLSRLAHNTVAGRCCHLRAFYAFCRKNRWRKDDPMAEIDVRWWKDQPKRPHSSEELTALLGGCRNARDRAMIRVGYCHGLRVSEIVGITADDVDIARDLILVRGKGGKQRWLALEAEAKEALLPFLGHRNGIIWRTWDGRPLTVKRAQRNMESIAKRSGVRAHWHRLRTTFACDFLQETHDLDSLRIIMGHASADTTRRYTAFDEESRALSQMRRLNLSARLTS